MRKKLLFMIVLVIMLFTGTIHVSAAMQVIPISSDALLAEYSDDYFLTSAVDQSNNLAQLSIVASDAAYKDTTAFLKSCGFSDIVDKNIIKNQQTPMLHPIKVTMGHKTISSSEKKYDLYAILVRGTTDALEWVSNFDLDSLNRECADQFMIPKNSIKILFDSYKDSYSTPGATTKIWVTGHSRGGAVANLLAHDLSGKYSASNVYAYTFASANVVTKKFDDTNIFNYIIPEDVVPKVPPSYVRYGKDIVLNTKGYMDKLYQEITSKKYEGTTAQAHSLEAYMCAFFNTITFPEEDTRISMNITSKDLYPGEKILLEATVSGVSSKVKWKSSDKKIATVSSSGNVTAKKAGIATITAYVTGGDKKIKETTCSITVKENRLTLNKSNATIYISGTDTVKLVATVSGASSEVKWTSSNKKIATVSSKGLVTAKKAGTVTITATANGIKATCKVTVRPSIELNKTSATIYTSQSKTLQLIATVKGTSSKVTWLSSNKEIATVSSKGKVTAKKNGTVTITAMVNGVAAKCIINILSKNPYDLAVNVYNAYVRNLKSDFSTVMYDIVDIDDDGVPELLITARNGCGINYVYTYDTSRNKMVLLKEYGMGKAAGCGITYNKIKKMFTVFTANTGGSTRIFYKLNRNKISEIAIYEYQNGKFTGGPRYYINGEEYSESMYNQKLEMDLNGFQSLRYTIKS